MYVVACSLLIMCTEFQLEYNSQTSNNAVREFTFHHIIYLNTIHQRVFKCIKTKISINTDDNLLS